MMPKSKRRNERHWQISNVRARKLRQKGVVVFYWSDGRTGYRGMARMNPLHATHPTDSGGEHA